MNSRLDWIEETDQPAMAILASNHLSRMARGANQITEEVSKIRQRVDKMIQTFERTEGILSHGQNPDVEVMEDVEYLENVLHDLAQKKKYQQKLTVFIVGYEETCGQRRNLLTQLQEFFSIYSNLNGEEDQKLLKSTTDLDGIAHQVTQAVRSAEAAMSRLADIHAGIMSCVNQSMSARTQDKRKTSDDRGKKKLEKMLDQARQDIGQLTDQLLQAQKDLILKDQQMKELVTQNERRFLEIQHVKSQLEVTKRSLKTLQDETAVQRSLLEAELRRQEGQLKELECQEMAKYEQLTDTSTQVYNTDDIDSMSEDEVIPVITEEENNIKDFMEPVEQGVLADYIVEHTEITSSEMELQVTDNDMSATEYDQPVSSLQVFDENTSDTILSEVAKEHNSVTVPVNVKECDAVPTIYVLSENSQLCERPAPINDVNIASVEPGNKSELYDSIGNNMSATESEKAFDVSQESTETNSIYYKSEENILSYEDKSDYLNVTESMEEAAVSQGVEEQITNSMALLTVSSNESHVVESSQECGESNHHPLSIAVEEKQFNSIPASDERQLSSPTNSSDSQATEHLGTVKTISSSPSAVPSKDADILMLIHNPNKDSFLMLSPAETVEATKLENDVQLFPPASNTSESLSSSLNPNNNFSISTSSQEAYHEVSVPESNNTATLTSFSVQNNLADSPSLQTDSLPSVTSLALHSVNSKTEDNVHTESHAESIQYTVLYPVGNKVDPAGSSDLCEDVKRTEMKKAAKTSHTEQANVPNKKRLSNEDNSAEIWNFAQILHVCVQEIRDLLINKGFYSLVDDLTAGKDCNGDEKSRNLMQLKHLPAVLQSLLHSAPSSDEHKQTADEPAHSSDITRRNMETQTDSHMLVRSAEAGGKHSISFPSRIPSGINSSRTHTLIFTRLDEEHNRRLLQRASDQGKIPLHVYQDARRAMSEYRKLRQERLRSLASGYVQYISWNKVENHLQRQCHTRPNIKPTLSKIKVLKHQVLLHWKEKRQQSQQEKLNLTISLNQLLHGVQEDSGIFLIKPVLSWSGRSSVKEGQSQIVSHYRVPQRPRLPPLDQDGILCSGKTPPYVPKEWKTIYTDTEIRPVVVTPKLLEMDVHRYLCKEDSVSQTSSSAAGLLLRTIPPQKLVRIKKIC
ncbi:uncharacterized protein ACMZJ9_004704 [Mantella aurantiaca]